MQNLEWIATPKNKAKLGDSASREFLHSRQDSRNCRAWCRPTPADETGQGCSQLPEMNLSRKLRARFAGLLFTSGRFFEAA